MQLVSLLTALVTANLLHLASAQRGDCYVDRLTIPENDVYIGVLFQTKEACLCQRGVLRDCLPFGEPEDIGKEPGPPDCKDAEHKKIKNGTRFFYDRTYMCTCRNGRNQDCFATSYPRPGTPEAISIPAKVPEESSGPDGESPLPPSGSPASSEEEPEGQSGTTPAETGPGGVAFGKAEKRSFRFRRGSDLESPLPPSGSPASSEEEPEGQGGTTPAETGSGSVASGKAEKRSFRFSGGSDLESPLPPSGPHASSEEEPEGQSGTTPAETGGGSVAPGKAEKRSFRFSGGSDLESPLPPSGSPASSEEEPEGQSGTTPSEIPW